MIAEALKYLNEVMLKAETPVVLLDSPRKQILAIGGNTIDVVKPPAPRNHRVSSLFDLINLATRFATETDTDPLNSDDHGFPVVWYDEKQVVLLIDDTGHRVETATLALTESEVFSRVRDLANSPEWFAQKDFVRLLRIDLAGTLPASVLLNQVRKVSFAQGQTTTGEVRRNQESMGREITSKVHSDGEIPEEVTLSVPVYCTAGECDHYAIRCALEVDTTRCAFQLVPLPDEVQRVQQLAIKSIGDRLRNGLPDGLPEGVWAYYGRPH